MREVVLNKDESRTVMEMVQDCIDRGMFNKDYELETIEGVIKSSIDFFEDFTKDFEITIKVVDRKN